jgi:hypothetical protein
MNKRSSFTCDFSLLGFGGFGSFGVKQQSTPMLGSFGGFGTGTGSSAFGQGRSAFPFLLLHVK